jgi:hypothetical protein
MHFYRINRFDGDSMSSWEGTLGEAHRGLKRHSDMPEARIELFDIDTSKESLLQLLNYADVDDLGLSAERTWVLTPRGGLKEVPNGE